MPRNLPYVNQSIKAEHDSDDPATKKVSMYGWDEENMQKVRVVIGENGGVIVSPVQSLGEVDESNSTSAPLGVDGVFTGSATDILNYEMLMINVYSDVDSAIDGLSIQQSSDGIDWDHTDDFMVLGGSGKNFSIQRCAKYYRVVYINGGIAQTDFRLQVVLSADTKGSSHRIKDEISGEDDSELVKAALTGENGDGDWHNVGVTKDGDLTISDNSSGLAISQDLVTGTSTVHKFGLAPDFDAGDGFVTIWDGASDDELDQMQYVWTTTSPIDSVVSSSSSDTQEIIVEGLDFTTWEHVEQAVTLNGQTRVALDTDLVRCYRAYNASTGVSASDLVGTVSVYEDTPLTGGVPADTTKIKAAISGSYNQTLMAVYTIPAGKKGYLRAWFSTTAGGNKDAAGAVTVWARRFDSVFRVAHASALMSSGSSDIQFAYIDPPEIQEKTDIELRVNTDQTATAVAGGFDIVLVDIE